MRPVLLTLLLLFGLVAAATGVGAVYPSLAVEPPERDFEISLPADAGGGAAIYTLWVDGHRADMTAVERDPSFQLLDNFEDLCLFADGSAPGSVRVRGRTLVLVCGHAKIAGQLVVKFDGEEHPVAANVLPTNGLTAEQIDDPKTVVRVYHGFGEPPYSWLAAGATFGGLLLLLLLLCPWRRGWQSVLRADSWIAIQVAVLHAIVQVGQQVGITADSAGYWSTSKMLLHDGHPDYFPPGYSVFTALFRALPLPGPAVEWITWFQAGSITIASIAFHRFLRPAVHPAVAFLAALLAGSTTSFLCVGRAILSEGLSMPLILLTLSFSMAAIRSGKYRYAILAGLAGGYATVTRVTPILIAGVCALAMLWPWRKRGVGLAFVQGGLVLAIAALPIAWFAWNGNQPVMATSSGGHVFNRLAYGDNYLHLEGPKTKELLALIGDEDPYARDHVTLRWAIAKEHGLSNREIDSLQAEVAKEAILHDPVRFLLSCIVQAGKHCWGPPGTAWAGWARRPREGLVGAPLGGVSKRSVEWITWTRWTEIHVVWPLLNVFGLVGVVWIVMRSRRRETWLVVWALIATVGPDACLDIWTDRRTTTAGPFLFALAMIGGWALLNGFRRYPDPESDAAARPAAEVG